MNDDELMSLLFNRKRIETLNNLIDYVIFKDAISKDIPLEMLNDLRKKRQKYEDESIVITRPAPQTHPLADFLGIVPHIKFGTDLFMPFIEFKREYDKWFRETYGENQRRHRFDKRFYGKAFEEHGIVLLDNLEFREYRGECKKCRWLLGIDIDGLNEPDTE